jgi:hypothetical protein
MKTGWLHYLALDVPQRDVDSADGGNDGTLSSECDCRAVHFFKEIFGIQRIFS